MPPQLKLPPGRVLIVAEATVAASWLALIVPLAEWEDLVMLMLYVVGASQLPMLPALLMVWRSAVQGRIRRRGTVALHIWRGTVLAGFLVSVVVASAVSVASVASVTATVDAGTDEEAALAVGELAGFGFKMLLGGLTVGMVMAASCTVVFGPAIWLTAMAIERAARNARGDPLVQVDARRPQAS